MSKSHLKVGILSVAPVVALAGIVACADSPTGVLRTPQRANLATALLDGQERPSYDAVFTGESDAAGRPIYTLDEVCDIYIGEEPVVAGDPEAPTRYEHQRVVRNVPAGAVIKLVGNAAMQGAGSTTFTCDATDRDAEGNQVLDPVTGQPQPVIDPVTLHAAKGDGPKIATAGITFDLNGHSITVSPSPFLDPTVDPAFENIGVVVTGDNVTVTNSSDLTAGGTVSKVFGFGHNIDVEAPVAPTIRGQRYPDATAVGGYVYNLETRGGLGVRLSGNALVEQVKSVNLDPVEGQGFEIRRCNAGSVSVIRNSHFEGGLEGAFIRECSGVTFENNYVDGHGGAGIATRQAVSTLARPVIIRGNAIASSVEPAIVWGRDSRSNNGSLVISGNKPERSSGTCDIGISTRNTTFGPYTLATLASANTWTKDVDGTQTTIAPRTCRIAD